MLNGILWILRTGSPWRDLPERFGPWQTVYDHFAKWRALGAYDRILEALHIRLDADGAIDWDLWCIDGSSVRASRAAAGASKKAAVATRKNRKTRLWAAREVDSTFRGRWGGRASGQSDWRATRAPATTACGIDFRSTASSR